jgi:hypothetical protein
VTDTTTKIQLSRLELQPAGPLRRDPPRPPGFRQPDYAEKFDFLTVFYDYFESVDGRSRILIGPPLFNLHDITTDAICRSLPRGAEIVLRKRNRMNQVWVPAAGPALEFPSGPFVQDKIVPQPNQCALFEGKRVLLTKSKDNELIWIRDWAYFFAAKHGCNAVLFYDNASQKYRSDDVRATLTAVPGIEVAVVVDWPFKHGPRGGPTGRWDSDFSQYGILEHARHRFLALAEGVISADVDEFVLTKDGASIFDYLARSSTGYVGYGGHWIESATLATGNPARHADFFYRLATPVPTYGKWSVVPSRCPPRAQWGVHEIFGMKHDRRFMSAISTRHFRAISTDWKYRRSARMPPSEGDHVIDRRLVEWLEVFKTGSASGEP